MKIMQLQYIEQLTTGDEVSVGK